MLQLNIVFVVFTAYSIMTLGYVQPDNIRGCHLCKPIDMLLCMTAVKKNCFCVYPVLSLSHMYDNVWYTELVSLLQLYCCTVSCQG
jgi:hypothetical protein